MNTDIKLTRKQYEYIRAREADIDMAYEHGDLSYLNQYPENFPPPPVSNHKMKEGTQK